MLTDRLVYINYVGECTGCDAPQESQSEKNQEKRQGKITTSKKIDQNDHNAIHKWSKVMSF